MLRLRHHDLLCVRGFVRRLWDVVVWPMHKRAQRDMHLLQYSSRRQPLSVRRLHHRCEGEKRQMRDMYAPEMRRWRVQTQEGVRSPSDVSHMLGGSRRQGILISTVRHASCMRRVHHHHAFLDGVSALSCGSFHSVVHQTSLRTTMYTCLFVCSSLSHKNKIHRYTHLVAC